MNKEVILITGTSKGIGLGISEYFSSKNYFVEGCSRGSMNIEINNYHHTIVDVGKVVGNNNVKSIIRI